MKEREGGCTISYITKCICCSISKRESERGKQAISDEREGGERGVQGTVQFKVVKSRYRKSIGLG